jgi:Gpi18-like mannosyltransferase
MQKVIDYFAGIRKSIALRLKEIRPIDLGILIISASLAILIRFPLLDFKSADFFNSLKPWYLIIRNMGFSAFGTNFSTYTPPYLYLLYIIARFFPDVPIVIAIKLPGLIADFICAYFVGLIVRLRFPKGLAPFAAAIAVLFAPTIVLNSAFWGQADSLFTAGLLACTYFLMTRRYTFALLAFGVALAFKLQAIFLVPLLLVLFLRGTISWKPFVLVPVILVVAVIPAWAAGRPILELLGTYIFQASQFQSLTMNAPSLYAWLPDTNQVFNLFYLPGIIIGAAAAFMFIIVVYKSRNEFTPSLLLELTLVSVLIIPFFLPKMHERYFYPADIISIAFAFYYPQLFYLPILIGGVSFLAYYPFLFETWLVPLSILTLIMLIVIGLLVRHASFGLYAPSGPKSTFPEPVFSNSTEGMAAKQIDEQEL